MSNTIAAGTWAIDPSHSEISFSVRHLMVSKVRGHFTKFSGTLTIAEDNTKSSVTAEIDAASIDIETHPTWTFASTAVRTGGKGGYLVDGNLTIKGVTKPVVLDLEVAGTSTDPWGNTKAGFSASTVINRKDFGVEWNAPLETGGVLVGEDVTLTLEIQAALQA